MPMRSFSGQTSLTSGTRLRLGAVREKTVSVSSLPAVLEFIRALLAAGSIRHDRDGSVRFRCELYKRHLADHLT